MDEQLCFARCSEQDEDNTDDFDVTGPQVIADVVLAKMISL